MAYELNKPWELWLVSSFTANQVFKEPHLTQLSELVWVMKNEGVGRLATVQRWFRTVVIDVCLLFNVAVVFSSKYFHFLFVKPS